MNVMTTQKLSDEIIAALEEADFCSPEKLVEYFNVISGSDRQEYLELYNLTREPHVIVPVIIEDYIYFCDNLV